MLSYDKSNRRAQYTKWQSTSLEVIQTITSKLALRFEQSNIADIHNHWLEINDLKYKEKDFNKKLEKSIEKLLYLFTLNILFLKKYEAHDYKEVDNFQKLLSCIDFHLQEAQVNEFPITMYYHELLNIDEEQIYFSLTKIGSDFDLIELVSIYEDVISKRERKDLGKFFTEHTISKFIAALTITKESKRILDPMCGTGLFISSTLELLEQEDFGVKKEFVGFEINSITAEIAKLVFKIEQLEKKYSHEVKILNLDAFNPFIRVRNPEDLFELEYEQQSIELFDVIIGNPAYIRYQNLGQLYKYIPNEFKKAYIEVFDESLNDSKAQGQFINAYIRASLLGNIQNIEHFKERLKSIKKKLVSKRNEEELFWYNIVKGYSGLSDSTVPTWLLAYTLCNQNGQIGFITSNSWINRDYGAMLKLFFVQLTELKYVMDLSNIIAFDDAQVSTSIVITSKKKFNPKNRVKFIKFKQINNQNHNLHFMMKSILIGANCYKDEQNIERQFSNWLETLESDWEDSYVRIRIVEQQELVSELLEENKLLKLMPAQENIKPLVSKKWGDFFQKESSIDTLYRSNKWISINNLSININQGIRTGYNSFFYFKQLTYRELKEKGLIKGNIQTEQFTHLYWEDLYRENLIDIEGLNRQYVNIPTEYEKRYKDYILVTYNYVDLDEKEVRLAFIQKKYLKKAVRSIKDLNHYDVTNEQLPHYIFISGKGILLNDYDHLAKNYTIEEIEGWKNVGLHPFDDTTNAYIEEATKLRVQKNDGIIYVPEMPVLKTYQNKPTLENLPTYWYTLALQSRHIGDIFVNRINYKEIPFVLNDMSKPYVVDANFITITLENLNEKILHIYFAIFNSSLIRLQLEKNCTVMAGGALKIEATHLRRILVPDLTILSDKQLKILSDLGLILKNKKFSDKYIVGKIDRLLLEMLVDTETDVLTLLQEIHGQIESLKNERLKK
ncbi:N-6 DNA methylase [Metasolibacillus fluoroglycofenilyticus]|uniref:N-6 DNA methylase n=1 Tax=Metasolibacillus fluoroglycofenilyticus TaxID=1239396 RepID=UPI00137A0C18|nr:N-6 DNA methylase [Metasolibacillus fluoroglycofenilyticus]